MTPDEKAAHDAEKAAEKQLRIAAREQERLTRDAAKRPDDPYAPGAPEYTPEPPVTE